MILSCTFRMEKLFANAICCPEYVAIHFLFVLGTIADLAPGVKDGMRLLEAKAVEMGGSSSVTSKPGSIMFVRGETQGDNKDKVVNPDEIDIDEDDDDEEGEEEDGDLPVKKQNVPSEVFGSLKKNSDEDEDE